MTKIILVNGPPRSGKDTAQEGVPDSIRIKFAQAVKEGTHGAFGIPGFNMDYFENCKDVPHQYFLGKTPREAYIAFSEMFMKPFTGDEGVFGNLLVEHIERIVSTWHKEGLPFLPFIVTDSGFRDEALVLVEAFGAENILLLRVHREGCNFDNDSRGYIDLHDKGVKSFDIRNVDIEKYKKEVNEIIKEFCNANS